MRAPLLVGLRLLKLPVAVLAGIALVGCTTSSAAVPRGAVARPQAAGTLVAQLPSDSVPVVVFAPHAGNSVNMYVEIADTPETQESGLMNRSSMPDDHGMIFMFSREVEIPFWMKDTLIPLSIAFIDSNGGIVDIQEMQALSLDNHSPAYPYQYAVEANATWYSRHGIAVGDTVDVSQAVAASSVFGNGTPTPGTGQ